MNTLLNVATTPLYAGPAAYLVTYLVTKKQRPSIIAGLVVFGALYAYNIISNSAGSTGNGFDPSMSAASQDTVDSTS
jgi:hypothetical protein